MPNIQHYFTNPLFYNVLSFEALLSHVLNGHQTDDAFYVRNDDLDMNATRKLLSHSYYHNNDFDTILGLTGSKTFRGSDDADYGISVLGGACGDGER